MRRKALWLILLAVMVGAIILAATSDARAEEKPLVITSGNNTATATITITWRTVAKGVENK